MSASRCCPASSHVWAGSTRTWPCSGTPCRSSARRESPRPCSSPAASSSVWCRSSPTISISPLSTIWTARWWPLSLLPTPPSCTCCPGWSCTSSSWACGSWPPFSPQLASPFWPTWTVSPFRAATTLFDDPHSQTTHLAKRQALFNIHAYSGHSWVVAPQSTTLSAVLIASTAAVGSAVYKVMFKKLMGCVSCSQVEIKLKILNHI